MPKVLSTYKTETGNGMLFKNRAKSFVYNIQCSGSAVEWEGQNTPLYYVPGLPRDHLENIATVTYRNE